MAQTASKSRSNIAASVEIFASQAKFARRNKTEVLFNHSIRVCSFSALAGLQSSRRFDHELLYAGAMFHDPGLMPNHSSADQRFEVDGANAAAEFLEVYGMAEADVYTV